MATMPNKVRVSTKDLKKAVSGFNQYRYFKKIRKNGFDEYKTVPYTRRLAIKYFCLECPAFVYEEMKNCTVSECPLFQYRLGVMPNEKTPKDRTKAIRSFCMECSGDDHEGILKCQSKPNSNHPAKLCPLHPFRLSGGRTDRKSLITVNTVKYSSKKEERGQDINEIGVI